MTTANRATRANAHVAFAITLAVSLAACGPETPAEPAEPTIAGTTLQQRLNSLQETRDDVPGFAITIRTFDGDAESAATGIAAPDGRPMTSATPIRIASNTKTFVAAAILRLVEQGRMDLDAPIAGLISETHNEMLLADGYDTQAIHVRHLLMHAGGLNDHFAGDAYKEMVLANPNRQWTRTDQLRALVDTTDPLAGPGVRFAYSDSGYLLLGEVLERATNEPLGQAVRGLLKLDAIGLGKTWWDAGGARPDGVPDRAHQWLGGIDSYPIHGSMDAHGGGGLVATVDDLTRFFEALFSGRVFDDPATLELMTSAPGHPDGSPYRMGLFTRDFEGFAMYGHSGFWGTDTFVLPELGVAIASVSLDQSGIDDIRKLARDLAAEHTTKPDTRPSAD